MIHVYLYSISLFIVDDFIIYGSVISFCFYDVSLFMVDNFINNDNIFFSLDSCLQYFVYLGNVPSVNLFIIKV